MSGRHAARASSCGTAIGGGKSSGGGFRDGLFGSGVAAGGRHGHGTTGYGGGGSGGSGRRKGLVRVLVCCREVQAAGGQVGGPPLRFAPLVATGCLSLICQIGARCGADHHAQAQRIRLVVQSLAHRLVVHSLAHRVVVLDGFHQHHCLVLPHHLLIHKLAGGIAGRWGGSLMAPDGLVSHTVTRPTHAS